MKEDSKDKTIEVKMVRLVSPIAVAGTSINSHTTLSVGTPTDVATLAMSTLGIHLTTKKGHNILIPIHNINYIQL